MLLKALVSQLPSKKPHTQLFIIKQSVVLCRVVCCVYFFFSFFFLLIFFFILLRSTIKNKRHAHVDFLTNHFICITKKKNRKCANCFAIFTEKNKINVFVLYSFCASRFSSSQWNYESVEIVKMKQRNIWHLCYVLRQPVAASKREQIYNFKWQKKWKN